MVVVAPLNIMQIESDLLTNRQHVPSALYVNKEGKFLKKPCCCVGGGVSQGNLVSLTEFAIVKILKADILSISPQSGPVMKANAQNIRF